MFTRLAAIVRDLICKNKRIYILWENLSGKLCCCLFILLVISASACGRDGNGYVKNNDPLTETSIQDALSAFHAYILEISFDDSHPEIVNIKFIDFDNDKIPELVLITRDITNPAAKNLTIISYTNNSLSIIYDDLADANMFTTDFAFDSHGIAYIVRMFFSWAEATEQTFLTLRDGQWISALHTMEVFFYPPVVTAALGQFVINEYPVSEDEFRRAVEALDIVERFSVREVICLDFCMETAIYELRELINIGVREKGANTDIYHYINSIIAEAIEAGYRVIWNFWRYTGFWSLEDCRSYLILFLSRAIGLTAYGNIEHPVFEEFEQILDYLRFYIRLINAPDSEILIFYVNRTNLHIYDQDKTLLNPDGWLWEEPERKLSSEEIEELLWEKADAAQWFERYPEGDKLVDGVKYYCFKTFGWGDGSVGERHTGYIWINTITGEIERKRFDNLNYWSILTQNIAYVNVRFYYHCFEIDKNGENLPEAFLYNIIKIPSFAFNEYFIANMYTQVGIQILWLKFDGEKLYVNLHESELDAFNTMGSAGAYSRGIRMNNTIASIPGISSFEVFVDGIRGVQGWHFGFNYVAFVEDGSVIRKEYFYHPSAIYVDEKKENYFFNPFAEPLMEWFAGGIQLPEEYSMPSTKAFFVDVDGNGMQGVVAVRQEIGPDSIHASFRIFYMYNGEFFYMEIGRQDEYFPFMLTTASEGRLVAAYPPGDSNLSYTLFEIVNGRLDFSLTLQRHTIWDEETNELWNEYRRFDSLITHEDFWSAVVAHNITHVYWWMLLEDESERIISMNFR